MQHFLEHINQDIKRRLSKDKDSTVNKTEYRSKKMESTENAFGIKINEQVITNEQMIADHFNEFFINIASNLKQPLKPSHFEKLSNFINSKLTDDVFLIYP